MARLKGPLRIEGKLGDLSIYNSVYGVIVRQKGGASKEKIRKSKAFARLRNHHEEFTDCVRSSSLLHSWLRKFTRLSKDHTMVGRMNKLFHDVKNLDKKSEHGKRRVAKGLGTKEGKLLFEGFDLNLNAPLNKVLKTDPIVKGDSICLEGFNKRSVNFPKDATHMDLTGIISIMDLKKKTNTVGSHTVRTILNMKKKDVIARVLMPKGNGFVFYLIQLSFLKEVNKELLPLQEGNCLAILYVE